MKSPVLPLLFSVLLVPLSTRAVPVAGQVLDGASSNAIAGTRVTLFTSDLRFFREQRSSSDGSFQFSYIAAGTYQLGVAVPGYEYSERAITVSNVAVAQAFNLSAETNGGRWTIVGDTEPELLDGSGSGTLLPSGEVFFCHDTRDPIVFDPVSGLKWFPPDSLTEQGCHITTLNTDGGLFFAGGSMGGNPLDPVVKIAKTYWRNTNVWVRNGDMNVGRWYAGLVRLPDERLLVLGGELNDPGYGRTNGCEIYHPQSNAWTITGSFALPTEIPPAVLLLTGEVLKTWRYPEFYNIATGDWRSAANMIQARNGAASGDHADHEIVHLPDGRIMAVGIAPISTNADPRFVELYNPANDTWALGPNPRALRNWPEALMLPDGRVLAFGGQYSGPTPAPVPLANAGTIPNCTKVADLYDPTSNAWRPLADMNRFIHYHNVTVLVPDGRVIATGGAGLTSNRSFAGDDSSIEAFEPPYLFRGVRPRIDWLSTNDLVQGSNFTLRVSLTEAVSKLVLVSARATTHWVDSGPQRYLSLDFTQTGSLIEASVPSDPVRALAGYYILCALVDDIPSVGRIVRITPAPTPRPSLFSVSVTALAAAASESGNDSGTFRVSRTGPANAPLTVGFMLGGSAVNGADYSALSNYVVFPAGASNADIIVTPQDDLAAEGSEVVILSLNDAAGYNAFPSTNASIAVSDNEPNPPPLALGLSFPTINELRLTLTGPATRLYDIHTSTDLNSWTPWTTLINSNGVKQIFEPLDTNAARLFFRAQQQ